MPLLRVVLDTNVVLSSLLFRSGRLSQLRHSWQDKRFGVIRWGLRIGFWRWTCVWWVVGEGGTARGGRGEVVSVVGGRREAVRM